MFFNPLTEQTEQSTEQSQVGHIIANQRCPNMEHGTNSGQHLNLGIETMLIYHDHKYREEPFNANPPVSHLIHNRSFNERIWASFPLPLLPRHHSRNPASNLNRLGLYIETGRINIIPSNLKVPTGKSAHNWQRTRIRTHNDVKRCRKQSKRLYWRDYYEEGDSRVAAEAKGFSDYMYHWQPQR